MVLLDDALCRANKCEHQQTQDVMREDLTALPVSSQGTVIPLCPNFLLRSRDMIPNYGRHVLPTKLGGKPKFACILRKSEVYMVDCNNCHTPCDYAGHIKDTWCPLYTPAFCTLCKIECSMREVCNEA